MSDPRQRRHGLSREIVRNLARRHSTSIVLFHHAAAERLGLGPTDHKCLDLLRERGQMTGSELAAITGLTTGAITGVVARLEQAGFVSREPDPHDGRRQILSPVPARIRDMQPVFEPIRKEVSDMLDAFDAHQLRAIADYLQCSTDIAYRQIANLRAQARSPARVLPPQTPSAAKRQKAPAGRKP